MKFSKLKNYFLPLSYLRKRVLICVNALPVWLVAKSIKFYLLTCETIKKSSSSGINQFFRMYTPFGYYHFLWIFLKFIWESFGKIFGPKFLYMLTKLLIAVWQRRYQDIESLGKSRIKKYVRISMIYNVKMCDLQVFVGIMF